MKLTDGVKQIIEKLNNSGYEAYAVGGAVRDSYLGNAQTDVDVTTSATPDEMYNVFSGFKIYPTGLKHGTLTINSLGEMIEVTTFRCEEGYSDNRRPDKVTFVKSLTEDLKRRDFTVNAMAYSDKTGLIDLFDGVGDIERKVIRAVGNPEERFNEDALRILRALRFASKLNFEIESETEKAIFKTKDLLKKATARIRPITGHKTGNCPGRVKNSPKDIKTTSSQNMRQVVFAMPILLRDCPKAAPTGCPL